MSAADERPDSYSNLTLRRQVLWAARQSSAFSYQADMAKWLLASLLVINGGSLIALLNSPDRFVLIPQAGPWFAAGVGASIASGFFAWVNAALNVDVYDDLVDPLVAVGPEHFKPIGKVKSIAFGVTHWGTILIGIGSLVLAGAGAASVGRTISRLALLAADAKNSLPPCRAPTPPPRPS